MRPAREGFAPAENGRVYYEVAGEGPAIVLLHAGLWDRRTWDDQFEDFAREHTVVRLDFRGFGRSPAPEAPYSDIDDVVAVMDAVGVERAAIVGCSAGGTVAGLVALERPERVRALVLAAAGLYGYRWADESWDPHWAEVGAAVEAGDLHRAMDLELAPWCALGFDDPVGARIRAIAHENLQQFSIDEELARAPDRTEMERLEEIHTPTLVLVGDHDVPAFVDIADILAARIPGARRETIAGADHVLHMRQPEVFDRLVLSFLDGV
jgi:pimeloyl-ACP methyl ester carboxylesterase